MSLPRWSALVLALGAIVWPACGGGESGGSTSANVVTKITPAAAVSTPTGPAASSPEGSKTGSADALQKATFNRDAEYDRGAALAAARRFADARRVFEEAARLSPTDGALAASVALFAYLTAKRISDDVVERLLQAGQHANAERWAEAHADVDEAIRLAPDYPRAHGLRGTLLLQQGKLADALKAFNRVVMLDPRFAEGYYNRGLANENQGNDDRAIADYAKAIELDPADPKPLINRGMLYARQKRYELAIADDDKAASLAPALLNLHYNKGQALEQLGRPKDAAAEYRSRRSRSRRRNNLPRRGCGSRAIRYRGTLHRLS